ncbi:acyl-CoA synthetase [Pueribacillus theae]|uniref:Acyl-CoA synthetase n=1 Tax=Pueribacillus theae TaxID=2171751 RepID=A0A2U1K4X5_9BACI|nr:acyl-CoA synthetase [Pueribacillus theae]PWA12043.1 acyl-CoA synthetase [Pueribacillus theae]
MAISANQDGNLTAQLQRARRNTLSDILERTSRRMPEKFALAYGEERLTYAQLEERVNQTAHAFIQDGLKKGTMVAVLSKNSLDFCVVNFALARIGAVMVPINYMLNVDEVSYILQHAKITSFIASLEYAPLLDKAIQQNDPQIKKRYLMDVKADTRLPAILQHWELLSNKRQGMPTELVEASLNDDDLAHVLYTSGTESKPKGVMLTHSNLISEYVSCIVDGGMASSDVFIHALPLFHSAQLHCFLGPSIYLGASGIILDQANPELILETIEKEQATQLFCPPTVWISLLRHPDFDKRDLSSLQKCYYGAAIMPREILKELSERLPQAKFWNFYGQTEVAPLATVLQPEDQLRKLGSAGKPSLNVQTKIVDDDGNEVPPGQVGEIVHRTSHAMKGYLHDPEKTAEAFKGGWFHSGDLGVMDEEGYLTIVDRKKDMIKTGGENVSSREVEEAIYEFPGVSEVAVISVPDPYWIEAVTAIIVPKEGANLQKEDILSFCKEKLAGFKVPKLIEFTDSLPKNPSGKVLKRTLRDMYENLNS